MDRGDVKKVRTRLRWFTLIVTVLAGINSFFNGSIAQSNGTSATGIGGAFLTAFFVLIVVLIFISIPFNVLAFFVVRSNRYPERAFRRISRVLAVFTVIVSLLVAVYSYFGGFVAGSSTLKGAGSVIYSVIFTVIVMIIVVVIPVHVVAFLFFVIRGPKTDDVTHRVQNPAKPELQEGKEDDLNRSEESQRGPDLPPWTEEDERKFQQYLEENSTRPDIQSLSHTPYQVNLKELPRILADVGRLTALLMATGLSNARPKKMH